MRTFSRAGGAGAAAPLAAGVSLAAGAPRFTAAGGPAQATTTSTPRGRHRCASQRRRARTRTLADILHLRRQDDAVPSVGDDADPAPRRGKAYTIALGSKGMPPRVWAAPWFLTGRRGACKI